MRSTAPPRWERAHAEDTSAVDTFLRTLAAVPDMQWHGPIAPGRWSGAALGVHIALAYELGSRVGAPDGTMALRVPPLAAWFAGHVILPLALRAGWFPRGAASPREVVPVLDAGALPTREQIDARIRGAMRAAQAALLHAETTQPSIRFAHAYFGAMPPYREQQLLTAHTRHHTRVLVEDLDT